jgi:hypothetical protein
MATIGKIKSLIASVPTRWGSQVCSIKSILNNRIPLEAYAENTKTTDTLKRILRDSDMWQQLRSLNSILQPIHEAPKMSESNKASLDKVYPR